MRSTATGLKAKKAVIKRDLKEVDVLFASIENDKNLPTFVEFFMHCLIIGNVEHVNLKTMYPSVYLKLNVFLKSHNSRIVGMRKQVSKIGGKNNGC